MSLRARTSMGLLGRTPSSRPPLTSITFGLLFYSSTYSEDPRLDFFIPVTTGDLHVELAAPASTPPPPSLLVGMDEPAIEVDFITLNHSLAPPESEAPEPTLQAEIEPPGPPEIGFQLRLDLENSEETKKTSTLSLGIGTIATTPKRNLTIG